MFNITSKSSFTLKFLLLVFCFILIFGLIQTETLYAEDTKITVTFENRYIYDKNSDEEVQQEPKEIVLNSPGKINPFDVPKPGTRPVKAYKFIGWYVKGSEPDSLEINFTTYSFTEDTVLEARWKPVAYVHFAVDIQNQFNPDPFSDQIVELGQEPTPPRDDDLPAIENFDFKYWYRDQGGEDDYLTKFDFNEPILEQGRYVLKPYYKRIGQVNFDPNNGELGKASKVYFGDPVPKPAEDPNWEGHDFLGWADKETGKPFDFDNYRLNKRRLDIIALWSNTTYELHIFMPSFNSEDFFIQGLNIAFNADNGAPYSGAIDYTLHDKEYGKHPGVVNLANGIADIDFAGKDIAEVVIKAPSNYNYILVPKANNLRELEVNPIPADGALQPSESFKVYTVPLADDSDLVILFGYDEVGEYPFAGKVFCDQDSLSIQPLRCTRASMSCLEVELDWQSTKEKPAEISFTLTDFVGEPIMIETEQPANQISFRKSDDWSKKIYMSAIDLGYDGTPRFLNTIYSQENAYNDLSALNLSNYLNFSPENLDGLLVASQVELATFYYPPYYFSGGGSGSHEEGSLTYTGMKAKIVIKDKDVVNPDPSPEPLKETLRWLTGHEPRQVFYLDSEESLHFSVNGEQTEAITEEFRIRDSSGNYLDFDASNPNILALSSGSTLMEMKASFLNTLTPDNYTYQVAYREGDRVEGGTIECTFEVHAKEQDIIPVELDLPEIVVPEIVMDPEPSIAETKAPVAEEIFKLPATGARNTITHCAIFASLLGLGILFKKKNW